MMKKDAVIDWNFDPEHGIFKVFLQKSDFSFYSTNAGTHVSTDEWDGMCSEKSAFEFAKMLGLNLSEMGEYFCRNCEEYIEPEVIEVWDDGFEYDSICSNCGSGDYIMI